MANKNILFLMLVGRATRFEVPRYRDLVIFLLLTAMTTTTEPITSPLMHVHGIITKMAKNHTFFKCF